MKVTILWPHWSGYMDACAEALAARGAAVSVYYYRPAENAPFDQDRFFAYAAVSRAWSQDGEFPWAAEIIDTAPDVILVASWHIEPYRRIAKALRGRSLRLLCLDNQWHGTFRQYLGSLTSPFYIAPLYDLALVPGARQRAFARRLGFADPAIIEGHYSCNQPLFAALYPQRQAQPINRSFAFVGRLIESKGIACLIEAWQAYRQSNGPWELRVYGSGPWQDRLMAVPGIVYEGFVQPDELPAKLLQSDVLVLPSLFEPWGLVLHEAASTGMPIVCSTACGGGDAFVRDGDNGAVVAAGDSAALSRALLEISGLPEAQLRAKGARSFALAAQRTPGTWAESILRAARQRAEAL